MDSFLAPVLPSCLVLSRVFALWRESTESVVMCNVAEKHCVNIRAVEPTCITSTGTTGESHSVYMYQCLSMPVLTAVKTLVYPLLHMLIVHINAPRGRMWLTHLHAQ